MSQAPPKQALTKPIREKLSIDREPPNSTEAEQGCLSCCLIDPPTCIAICIEKFQGNDAFFDTRHQDLFFALQEMYDGATPIDEITLRQKLSDSGMLEAVGGAEYIQFLRNISPSPANLPFYLEIMWDQLALRKIVKAGSQMVNAVYEKKDGFEVSEILEEAERNVFQVGQIRFSRKIATTKDVVRNAISLLEDMFVNRGALRGLPSGLTDLDKFVMGFKGGALYVFAARPGLGKTSLAMQIAEHVAVDKKIPVGVFSLEMTAEELCLRMMSSRAEVNLRKVERGFFSQPDQDKLSAVSIAIAASPLYFEDESSLSIMELRSKARRMVQLYGIKLFVVDYIQLLHSSNKKVDSRQEEIADITNGLKNMAKELGVPVIALCQLNRDIEKRSGPPKMSDLRESGAIEQDADLIGILWKESAEEPSTEEEAHNVVEKLSILKQRNGPTGDIDLLFRKYITRFAGYSAKTEPTEET